MFDRSQSRVIIVLGLLGFFTCFSSLPLLSSITTLDFRFPVKKDAALNAADEFLVSQGVLIRPLAKKAVISSDRNSIIYIQKKIGPKKSLQYLKALPVYYWQVDYSYRQKKAAILSKSNQIKILIEPNSSKVIGFNRIFKPEDYKEKQILSKDKSEGLANDFFSRINFNISDFSMSRYSSIEGKYIFEWEKDVSFLKTAKLRAQLEIFGDKVGNFRYFLDMPQRELWAVRFNNFLATAISLSLYTLVILFGFIISIICFLRRREIQWKFGLIFALLMTISFSVTLFRIGNYSDYYLTLFLTKSILFGLIIFFWIEIAASASKLFSGDSKLGLFPIKIQYSIYSGYVFFFSGMGLTMFFFIVIIGIFNPIMTMGFDTFFSEFPSTKLSCLIAPLLSLGAAISEEVLFRGLMISFLKKYFKTIFWPVIISTLIWSFLHVSPGIYSNVYPNFVQGIILLPIGFLFSYIFIRFGLVSAIVTHYLHDLVVIGATYLEFSNFRYVNINIMVMLIAAIIPLVIAFSISLREKNA